MDLRRFFGALVTMIGAAMVGGLAVLAGAPAWAAVGFAALAAAVACFSIAGEPWSEVDTETSDVQDRSLTERGDAPLEAAFNALPIGAVLVARDRTIKLANPEVEKTLGVRGIAGLPVETLRSRRLLDQIDLGFEKGGTNTLDFTLSRGRDIALKAHIRALSTGDVLVGIEDRTQAIRAGDLHRDFVANASHELKTPLAATSGIIETLLGHARDDPDATERFLGLLATQTERMIRLVEDLLSLNRIELNERMLPDERHDVTAIIDETVDALRPIADAEKVELVTSIKTDAAMVMADRDELNQLFGNLIDNAIKYGGEAKRVEINEVPPSPDHTGMFGIEIVDQGPGIPREHIPRLTERFYRVSARHSREKGGTGLGLAIAKHILNRHRGQLQVESVVGEGSRFCVWLPLTQSSSDVFDSSKNVTSEDAV